MFRKTFEPTGQTFGAHSAARSWCRENGYSVGTMCGPDPIGIKAGSWTIAKWRNLKTTERAGLDGTMTSTDWREGSVTVEIKDARATEAS